MPSQTSILTKTCYSYSSFRISFIYSKYCLINSTPKLSCISIAAMLKFYLDTGKPMSQDDAVKVAPDSYKIVLENDQVRVLEVRIRQGAKSEMHSHPRSVAICLNDQRLKFTFPNGKSENADLKRGQTVWLDGISHTVENIGTEDVSSVVVELKK
jgi:quercetin dioxygenase-like cupin family protein